MKSFYRKTEAFISWKIGDAMWNWRKVSVQDTVYIIGNHLSLLYTVHSPSSIFWHQVHHKEYTFSNIIQQLLFFKTWRFHVLHMKWRLHFLKHLWSCMTPEKKVFCCKWRMYSSSLHTSPMHTFDAVHTFESGIQGCFTVEQFFIGIVPSLQAFCCEREDLQTMVT